MTCVQKMVEENLFSSIPMSGYTAALWFLTETTGSVHEDSFSTQVMEDLR